MMIDLIINPNHYLYGKFSPEEISEKQELLNKFISQTRISNGANAGKIIQIFNPTKSTKSFLIACYLNFITSNKNKSANRSQEEIALMLNCCVSLVQQVEYRLRKANLIARIRNENSDPRRKRETKKKYRVNADKFLLVAILVFSWNALKSIKFRIPKYSGNFKKDSKSTSNNVCWDDFIGSD